MQPRAGSRRRRQRPATWRHRLKRTLERIGKHALIVDFETDPHDSRGKRDRGETIAKTMWLIIRTPDKVTRRVPIKRGIANAILD